ncbi:hypothetical protein Ancab_039916 [Ancistrocladus abbreviatus]
MKVENEERVAEDSDPKLMWEQLTQQFYTKSQAEKKKLVTFLDKYMNPSRTNLQESSICVMKGRPRRNFTRHEPPAWKYTEKMFGKSPSKSPSSRNHGCEHGRRRGRGRSPSSPVSITSGKFDIPFVSDIEPHMVPCIHSWVDVVGDGNCGYRAVAVAIGLNENAWAVVRRDLWLEMRSRINLYASVFVCDDVVTVMQGVAHWCGLCDSSHWMTMPDIGHVIATRYHVVVVLLSRAESITFLPLTSTVNYDPPTHVITLALLEQTNHFIMINLIDDALLPPLVSNWQHCHEESVNGWDLPFHSRFEEYIRFRPKTSTQRYINLN